MKKIEIMEENFVWAKEEVGCKSCSGSKRDRILADKKYRLYAQFESDVVFSGVCYVVLTEQKQFVGFDSDYFISEAEYEASKYNI